MTHVPSRGFGRRGGSKPCMQRGTLSQTFPKWEMGEDRKISAIYIVGDIQSDMSPVEVEGGEENLCHVHSGETLSDTCP